MRLDEPFWWYREKARGMAVCLAPIGAAYGWAAKARFRRGKPYRSRFPVICVGNFTAGGTGKTPLAIHLCERLRAAGHEPVLLTRGYRGGLSGPYWVNRGTDIARDVGDEALLLARAAPTHLARDRQAGARAIETGPHPVTVIIMDDGLQNPSLAKDLSIAVVDGSRGIGNGKVIPAGPLRAPLDFQLELTDAVIVNEQAADAGSHIAEWMRRHFNGPVLRAVTVPAEDTSWLEERRVVAWAGIGAPQRFFDMLRTCKADVRESIAFRDHQILQQADALRLLTLATQHDATLVTTEKDLARLGGAGGQLELLADSSRVLPIKLRLEKTDSERLSSLLDMALKARA